MRASIAAVLLGILGCAAVVCAKPNEEKMVDQNGTEHKVPVVSADMPQDSPTITVYVSGLVRNNFGEPLPNAAVELQMNPYYQTPASTRTWTATDSYGRYYLTGQGHYGTARVKAASEGYRMDVRELGFIKRSRELGFNFSLAVDRPSPAPTRSPAPAPSPAR